MIEEPKLLRISKNLPRPSAKQIEALNMVPTGVANDAMGGTGLLQKPSNTVTLQAQLSRELLVQP